MDIYREQPYILVWRDNRAHVLLRDDALPRDALRPVWQAAWLDLKGVRDARHADLVASLHALELQWDSFLAQCQQAGWTTHFVTIRAGETRYRHR